LRGRFLTVGCALTLLGQSFALAQSQPPPQGSPILPDDASIITDEESKQLLSDPNVLKNDEQIDKSNDEARQRRARENEAVVADFVKANPKLRERFANLDPNGVGAEPLGDGNFLIRFRNERQEEQEVVTHGRDFIVGDIATGIRQFPTKENQLSQYSEFYKLIQRYEVPGIQSTRFPSPRKAVRYGDRTLLRINDNLARRLVRIKDIFVPVTLFPPACEDEVGYDEGRDQTGAACGNKPLGVYNNYNWPLKRYLTCVKNQARRGSCVSFAVTAATETAIAKKYSRWVNLSEQDLYYRGTGVWYPRTFGDGLPTASVASDVATKRYVFPYEEQWDYNPSPSRQNLPASSPNHYENSCDGYDGSESLFCSDTAHQGQRYCYNPIPFLDLWTCFFLPAPATAPSPYKVASVTQLWDVADTDLSFVKLILTLALAKRPVVLALPVHTSWDTPDANGYVRGAGLPLCPPDTAGRCTPVAGSCECNRGGHAVTAVGFVDNTKLPPGAPAGAGGGYIIIKNSWGRCFADGGYIYVPYNWIKNLTYSATAITSVTK